MSATNRGAEREAEDTYITPRWTVERFLEAYEIPQGASVLDPCCAEGELLAELKKLRPDLRLYGFELRPEVAPALEALAANGTIEGFSIGDFLASAAQIPSDAFDYVLTNPPYALAQAFVEACEKIVKEAAIFLLRINFLGSQDRHSFTVRTRPSLFILPNRPCFTGWGSDATEYAWFAYDGIGVWYMLALTPAAIISAANRAAKARYPHLNPKILKAAKAARKASASGEFEAKELDETAEPS